MKRKVIALLVLVVAPLAQAHEDSEARATYIANMGAMIERGDAKVLFDPLFKNDFGTYDLAPAEIEAALLAGTPPWDGIDAIFISHYHEDHFDPATVLQLLRNQSAIVLFAPEQAASAIRELIGNPDDSLSNRIRGISLENGEAAVDVRLGSLLIEAIRVPHGGWPERHSHVENMVYRVTLDDNTTVMHFGDAESTDELYTDAADYWNKRRTHFAMPPYWFFLSDEGRQILSERIAIDHAVGMHVPKQIAEDPEDRREELRDVDLFTRPGETRDIAAGN